MTGAEGQPFTYEELLKENESLRVELEALREQNPLVWPILTETGRRLQLYSAAIKASVSSLLNYDILWDAANEHEFLETINTSVDQVGKLITLLALTFRLESGSLVLKMEPQILQEIIYMVQAKGQTHFPNLVLLTTLPGEGRYVQVDYQYLTLTLEFLLEVLEQADVRSLHLSANEEGDYWRLTLKGLSMAALNLVQQFQTCGSISIESASIPAEYLLRLHLVCQLLDLQAIKIDIPNSGDGSDQLSLLIPAI